MRYDAEFLGQIIEAVAHPIFVKDRAFAFVLVNRACGKMVGRDPALMIGKTDYDLFPEAEADFFRKKDAELFDEGVAVHIDEESITDANGLRHVLATTKVPLRAPDGTITHLVGIIHDITALKEAEEALRHANEELEQRVAERTAALDAAQEDLMRKERLAVLGQLAGGVAHQIRNPLAAIKNAAYVIDRVTKGRLVASSDGHTSLAQAIAVIHDEVDGANQTISTLLDHARIRHAVRRPIDVATIVEAVLAAHPPPPNVVIDDSGASAEGIPRVAVDFEQVRSALSNVVRNAYEAMPAGGRLVIDVERLPTAVLIRIQDEGTGIAPDIRARLFEPLVTSKPLGLGLGLVTARTLLVGQGGGLEFEPSAHGATFCVRLPIASASVPPPP